MRATRDRGDDKLKKVIDMKYKEKNVFSPPKNGNPTTEAHAMPAILPFVSTDPSSSSQ